ncbi:Eukaryotic translation initiation factor 2 subunit 2 [Monocercomonoides exilis]|uniref:Eukaryotic translation initiation factor 2 subunit 2 n=1 Tax=Monocercomonoides exilis TaxID=2049356 RepID=UPI00355A7C34|nr:Eukaryotic translation initiation factor 2 subunit 2 [Monocercomonoides exilis]|eukprot:MONOS_8323.1-p1 / transcript=MONOS_8323.1 / gene=MONOS_8323 / organism=Monocercomonoides_exilis_PA203 / gene_product=Eukaryotic translation initiation factor 2 subunit 2 / transcript_product=Eukaryotic translation initiation factor 2 subunit 2 / location=Mono_scaffold00311:65640-66812(+) / protein_length=261 / sequence_SO=supercontig / SO=protein_coding / is_pseudo=false
MTELKDNKELISELYSRFGSFKRPNRRRHVFTAKVSEQGSDNANLDGENSNAEASSSSVPSSVVPISVSSSFFAGETVNSTATSSLFGRRKAFRRNALKLARLEPLTYDQMLDHAFEILQREHPELVQSRETKSTLHLKSLNLQYAGRNTIITNFEEICKILRRPMDHVMQFLFTELACKGSLTGENHLTLRERYHERNVEKTIKEYIKEYIMCKSCKSPHTQLLKNDRTLEIACEECHASRCVQAIKQQAAITKVRKGQ